VIQNLMRIVLDEEEILQACKEWIDSHHSVGELGNSEIHVVHHSNSADCHMTSVIIETVKSNPSGFQPYR
jgi:hypothetical protein